MDEQIPNQQPNIPEDIHPHTHKVLWIVLGVLFVLFIAGAGYWWKAEKETVQNLQQANQPIIQDETKDWKTYTNKEYGFEFRYPALGDSHSIDGTGIAFEGAVASYDLSYEPVGEDYLETAFVISVLDAKPLILEELYEGDECLKTLMYGQIRFFEANDISFARFFEEGSTPPTEDYMELCPETFIVADIHSALKDKIIRLEHYGQTDLMKKLGFQSKAEVDQLINQMLSTFKFTQ